MSRPEIIGTILDYPHSSVPAACNIVKGNFLYTISGRTCIRYDLSNQCESKEFSIPRTSMILGQNGNLIVVGTYMCRCIEVLTLRLNEDGTTTVMKKEEKKILQSKDHMEYVPVFRRKGGELLFRSINDSLARLKLVNINSKVYKFDIPSGYNWIDVGESSDDVVAFIVNMVPASYRSRQSYGDILILLLNSTLVNSGHRIDPCQRKPSFLLSGSNVVSHLYDKVINGGLMSCSHHIGGGYLLYVPIDSRGHTTLARYPESKRA